MEPTLTELLLSGARLMLIGMGIVYLFLALLVWIIGLTARLLHRDEPPEPAHGLALHGLAPEATVESDDAEIVAAIATAIHRYQNP
jgi:oxaloacetate decarboxylase gamma subunit